MSLAELVIVSVKVEGRSKSEVARDYKISRYWVQQLVKRYEAEGEAAFVTAQPRKRPKGAAKRFWADMPNERWQADITHWQLADGTGVEILNMIDDHSRLDLLSKTCGKVERFHQTQKKWLTAQPAPVTITALQRQLDRFRRYYNTQRPHRAVGRRTPEHAYTARPKATPPNPRSPPTTASADRVDTGSVITLRYDSQLRHIGLGREHARKRVLALIADLYIRVVDAETGELLRELTLDPTRDYQPLGRPPGPPPKNP